jgi:anti-anti-sigma factor
VKRSITTTSSPRLASGALLDVALRPQGTTYVVAVTGEMDVSSVSDVRSVLDRALRDEPETLLLDLGQLEFCDSSGVHLVVHAHRRATAQGIAFLVLPPIGAARRVFDLCRVGDHVPFVGPDGRRPLRGVSVGVDERALHGMAG